MKNPKVKAALAEYFKTVGANEMPRKKKKAFKNQFKNYDYFDDDLFAKFEYIFPMKGDTLEQKSKAIINPDNVDISFRLTLKGNIT